MFKLNPNASWRWEGKDKVLLSTLVGMNRTAGEVLELCRQPATTESIVAQMTQRYPQVPPARIRDDLEKLIDRLVRWSILLPADAADAASPPLPQSPFYLAHVATYFNNRLSAPLGVACELTFVCDARCAHCYSRLPAPDPSELTTQEWKRVIDELDQMRVFRVVFSGGDPVLRADIEELVAYAAARGLKPQIATSGFTLTPQRIDSLVASGLATARIDFDGATAETHDRFRGLAGLYDRVSQAVPYLLERGVRVQLATTVSKLNLGEIPAIMDIAAAFRVTSMTLDRMHSVALGAALRPDLDDYVSVLPRIYRKDQEIGTLALRYPSLPAHYYARAIGQEAYQALLRKGKLGGCHAGITGCAISPTGDVKPCDLSVGISLGNIRQQPLAEVWRNSPILDRLRDLQKTEEKPCRGCGLRDVCVAGCRALPEQLRAVKSRRRQADPLCLACFRQFKGDSWPARPSN